MIGYDHDHDEDGNCIVPEPQGYSLKIYDIIGIGLTLGANTASCIAGSLGALGQEFFQAAAYARRQDVVKSQRRLLADDLRSFEKGEKP